MNRQIGRSPIGVPFRAEALSGSKWQSAMGNLRARVGKLEGHNAGGRCPLCRGRLELVRVFGPSVDAADYPSGELPEQDVPDDQLPPDALPCRACGWAPTVVVIVEVLVHDREQSQRFLNGMGEAAEEA